MVFDDTASPRRGASTTTRTMAWNGASGKSSQITGARACRASAPMRSEGFTEYTRSIYNNTSLHQCRRFRHRDDAFTRQPPPDPRSTARACTQGILGTANCLSRYSQALQHQPKHECAEFLQPKAYGDGFERAKWMKGSSAVACRFSPAAPYRQQHASTTSRCSRRIGE